MAGMGYYANSGRRPVEGGTMADSRLTRSRTHRVIAGVCGGIAEHYGWSVGLVRFLFVLFGLMGAG